MHKLAFLIILSIFLLIFPFSNKNLRELMTEGFVKWNISYLNNVCHGKNDTEICFVEKIKPMISLYGPKFVVTKLLYEIDDNDLLGGCHTLAHSVGKEIHRLDSDSSQGYISSSEGECEFGVAHGIIESMLSDSKVDVQDENAIRDICGDDEKIDCNHVVGHFLLVWTNKDVNKALSICDFLKKENQIYICYKGVFMEYITGQNLLDHNLINGDWLKTNASLPNLQKLCNKYKNLARISCWEELPHSIVLEFGNDIKKSLNYCDKAPDEISMRMCKNLASNLITGKILESEITFLTNN